MISNCHQCGTKLVKVNGRTLLNAHKASKRVDELGKIANTEWVEVCPVCHKKFLTVSNSEVPIPFLCDDGLMRTIKDLDSACQSVHLDFCGFRFTLQALQAAMDLAKLEDWKTNEVEDSGKELVAKLSPKQAFIFSQQVCEWGRGERVWANLKRRNGEIRLGEILNNWFAAVGESSDEEAISSGTDIKGLGVSFASKHLRMLSPSRFAVLDEVLSLGLGFALNTKGYVFFLNSLRRFQDCLVKQHSVNLSVATIESGIFMLVRQQVRAK